jgi:membrane associated rhomboid family serine protease
MAHAEASADHCYRHPQRTSWVLCERCGRTVCPECQILTPNGVRCPDCIAETGGTVQWERVGAPSPQPRRAPRGRGGAGARGGGGRPRGRVSAVLADLLNPGSTRPVLTWGAIAVVAVLWLVGFATANLPFAALAAWPSVSLQVWRYLTSWAAYPAALDLSMLSLVLNAVFFLLIAPGVERSLARRRFAIVFLTASALGSVAMVLAGGFGYGLSGALFGLFGAYLIVMWNIPPARTQALVIIAINVLINLVMGGGTLPAIVGGLVGGAGATFLLRHFEHRAGSRASTPYLIIGGVLALFVVLAIVRSI